MKIKTPFNKTEYEAQYYSAHKKELQEKRKNYYQTHKEEFNRRAREFYQRHKEKIKEEHKARYIPHPRVKPVISQKIISQPINVKDYTKVYHEPLNVDSLSKALDDYMEINHITQINENKKLFIFLKDKFGDSLTDFKYRMLLKEYRGK